MQKYINYLKYVLQHKYKVFIQCIKRGLYIHAITHDFSKFRPSEFIPYARWYYGEKNEEVKLKYREAYRKHYSRNKHHFRYWIGTDMPEKYIDQMICDMAAQSDDLNPYTLYMKCKDTMILSDKTRHILESKLLKERCVMENCVKEIKGFVESNICEIDLEDLRCTETVLVVVDMINGFIKEGPLASPRVEKIVPNVAKMMEYADERYIQTVVFLDTHKPDSVEFKSYPPHCIEGTSEAELVDELKNIGVYTPIKKGSTNGFIEPEFQKWLNGHQHIKNFIVTGCCTDICVEGFAMTLNQYANANHKDIQIIVPMSCVETYDAPGHNAELMNMMSLYKFMCNGIKVIK